jgi:hypothetical protein
MEHTRRPPSPGLYTLSDIEGWTRQPRRTLQGWGDAGVILAAPDTVHGGKGVHRRFPVAEVAVAVLVSPISDAGWPIGRLVPLAGILRQAILLAPGVAQATPEQAPGRAGTHETPIPRGRWRTHDRASPHTMPIGAFEIRRALTRAARGERSYLLIAAAPDMMRIGTIESAAGLDEFFRDGGSPGMALVLDLTHAAGILKEVMFA